MAVVVPRFPKRPPVAGWVVVVVVPVPNSDGLAAVFVAVVPNKPPVVPAWFIAVPVVAAGVPNRPPVAGAVVVAVPPKREGVT